MKRFFVCSESLGNLCFEEAVQKHFIWLTVRACKTHKQKFAGYQKPTRFLTPIWLESTKREWKQGRKPGPSPEENIRTDKSIPFSLLHYHDSGLGRERNTVDATIG